MLSEQSRFVSFVLWRTCRLQHFFVVSSNGYCKQSMQVTSPGGDTLETGQTRKCGSETLGQLEIRYELGKHTCYVWWPLKCTRRQRGICQRGSGGCWPDKCYATSTNWCGSFGLVSQMFGDLPRMPDAGPSPREMSPWGR
jgi:hypothetical protein